MKNLVKLPFKRTLNLLPDGILVADDQGFILLVNTRLEKMFGYEKNELPGQHLSVLMPERFHGTQKEPLAGFTVDPDVKSMSEGKTLFGIRKDGTEFDVAVSLIPVDGKEGQSIFATFRNITERMTLDRALKWKNEQLEAINEGLERFGFTITHDLKSPLANLQGIIDLILRGLPEDKKEELKEHIYNLHQTLYSMSDMIAGIAAYSKATLSDVTTGVEIDTNQLMSEVRYLILLPSHITLEVSKNMPVTWGNKTKILQVFLNLISNAIKYNDKKQGLIKVTGSLTTDTVSFCIEDNGPGIPHEKRKNVFDLFDKGASVRKDSQGIGLAIVAKIINELGGTITIDQSELGGARFKIDLPVMKPVAGN